VVFGNIAPALDLNGQGTGINFAATFTPKGRAVSVVDKVALTVADFALPGGVKTALNPNTATLKGATVKITNLLDGTNELLRATPGTTGITATYDAALGVLTLTGTATLAQYQQVLRTVVYNNKATNPNTTARTLEFVLQLLLSNNLRPLSPPQLLLPKKPRPLPPPQLLLPKKPRPLPPPPSALKQRRIIQYSLSLNWMGLMGSQFPALLKARILAYWYQEKVISTAMDLMT